MRLAPPSEVHEIASTLTRLVLPLSLAMAVLTLATLPFVLLRIPADYLLRRDARAIRAPGVLARIALDVVGAAMVLIGVALLVLPGQGLLAIFTGLVLMRFPGKRRAVRALLCRRSVMRPVNALRRRFGRPAIRRRPGRDPCAAAAPHPNGGQGEGT